MTTRVQKIPMFPVIPLCLIQLSILPLFLKKNLVIILEPLYAEPLISGVSYGRTTSENYMFIEPSFEYITDEKSRSNRK